MQSVLLLLMLAVVVVAVVVVAALRSHCLSCNRETRGWRRFREDVSDFSDESGAAISTREETTITLNATQLRVSCITQKAQALQAGIQEQIFSQYIKAFCN